MKHSKPSPSCSLVGRCALSLLAGAALLLPAATPHLLAADPPEALSAAKDFGVAIKRSSIGKDYFLSGSVIPQTVAPTSTGLAGKVVRFELFHDGLDLYESNQGKIVTSDLPARRLITTFPVLSQDNDVIVFDFNRGMRRVFSEMWISMGGFSYGQDEALEVSQSRVFAVETAGDQLVIRQAAQLRNREFGQNMEERYEVRYFLSPYIPGDFKSKENPPLDSRYVGYFMGSGQLEETTGRVSSLISRFDIRGPVKFYYSANTPADFEEAMKSGILYWNKAFGKEIIVAEKAPAGVTAPDASRNIIQWVPWDGAGSAYADVLLDPLTGRARHGQAYMTSTFAIGGKSRARALLRAMKSVLDEKKDDKKDDKKHDDGHGHALDGLDLPGPKAVAADPLWATSTVCDMRGHEFARSFVMGMESILAEADSSDKSILAMAQDYVRHVVAHEVGHVLGLRHNFAASLPTSLTHKELGDWMNTYLKTGEPPLLKDKLASTSVMEYSTFSASVFEGFHMNRNDEALPYDRAAIRWGYFEDREVVDKKLFFATDGHVGTYGDVNRFDYGAEPILSAYADAAETIRLLPNSVIETYIAAKAPRDPRDKRPLESVSLFPTSYAFGISSPFGRVLNWFRASTRSFKVESAFDTFGDVNRKELRQAHWKYLNDQVEKAGGVDRVLFSYLPVDLKLDLKVEPPGVPLAEKPSAAKLVERLKKLLDSPAYEPFVGLDEKTYSFSKEEKELILKKAAIFFEQLEIEVVKNICVTLQRAERNLGVEANGEAGDKDIVSMVEDRVLELAKIVITAKDEKSVRRGKVDKSVVEVPNFKYEQETRLAAARALDDKIGSYRAWSIDAKNNLHRQLKDDVEAALNIQNFKAFKDSQLSRNLRDWYLQQQDILQLLPPPRPDAAPQPAGPPR